MQGAELGLREQRLRGKSEHGLLKKTNSAKVREEESSEKWGQRVNQESGDERASHAMSSQGIWVSPQGQSGPPDGLSFSAHACVHVRARLRGKICSLEKSLWLHWGQWMMG